MMDNSTSATIQRAEREREELTRAIQEVIATGAGKRVLFWFLEQCELKANGFTGEAASTNYLLGKQAAGRKVIDFLDQIDPRLYPKLMLEVADLREVNSAIVRKQKEEDGADEAF